MRNRTLRHDPETLQTVPSGIMRNDTFQTAAPSIRGNLRLVGAIVGMAAIAIASAAQADPNECRAATDKFATSRANVFNAMQGYGHCVTANNGRDECSDQFSTLESAQNNFESAVSDYHQDC